MKYETTLLKERNIADLVLRSNVMIEEDWVGVGELRSDGTYYYLSMERLTDHNKDTWEM